MIGEREPIVALTPLPLRCTQCDERYSGRPQAICASCLAPLEPVYADDRSLPTREEIVARPRTIWRYREWLPFAGTAIHATETGWTPLIEVPRLARQLGVRSLYLKVDAWSAPTQSFKDRVVATAINAAHAFGLSAIGCASTGNLANAVAAAAARAGIPAWIFVPDSLETAKLVAAAIYRPHLVRVRGTYDDVNRLCAQLAERFEWGLVNVNLRAYYGEGSKSMAFEIAEQLGWRAPDAIVAPMAGGSLITKLDKGFREFADAGLIAHHRPRLYGGQAEGCAPIVRLFQRNDGAIVPEIPSTIAKSLAIGNPADGVAAARLLRASGGGAHAVTDTAIVHGIATLAATSGVFGETAAGVTVATALQLAERGALRESDEVVLCITGHGLKTVDAVASALDDAPVIEPKVRAVADLLRTFGDSTAASTSRDPPKTLARVPA
jgi:threonine synthase